MNFKFKILIFCLFVLNKILLGQLTYNIIGDGQDLGNGCFLITEELEFQTTGIWYNQSIDLTEDFNINFDLFFSNRDAAGADGMTLVFKPNPNPVIGGTGGNLGYGGINNSLAIEFDVWDNNPADGNFDPAQDHIAFLKNGVTNHNPVNPDFTIPPIVASATSPNIEDGNFHNVIVSWDALNQNMTVSFDCNQRITYSADIVSEIFFNNPTVYFGFTGSTGGFFLRQQLCFNSVSFVDNVLLQDKEICLGDAITDVDVTRNGNQVATYSWTPTTGVSNPNIPNPVFTPTETTTYTVHITDQCGIETFEESFTAVVIPPSGLDPGTITSSTGNNNLCEGNTIQLRTDGDLGGTWFTSNSSVSLVVDTIDPRIVQISANSLNTMQNVIISYNIDETAPCQDNSTMFNLSVYPLPNAGTLSLSNTTLCVGVTETVNTTGDTNGTWSSSNPSVLSIDSITGEFETLSVGTAMIFYEVDGTPCGVDSALPLTLTVVDENLNAGTIFGSNTVCVNELLQLSVSMEASPGFWISDNETIATVNQNGLVMASSTTGSVNISYTAQGVFCPDDMSTPFPITVISPPIIEAINTGSNWIEIVASGGSPPYEYSIDGVNFIPENRFNNLSPSNYTVFVRNQNGSCGIVQEETGIVFIPNIITPNGDHMNDTWNIQFVETFPNATISLFDRYGKSILDDVLLSNLNFNGVYLGQKLPSNTYWYNLRLNNSNQTVINGYFVIKNY